MKQKTNGEQKPGFGTFILISIVFIAVIAGTVFIAVSLALH